jgi:hypothetical protein
MLTTPSHLLSAMIDEDVPMDMTSLLPSAVSYPRYDSAPEFDSTTMDFTSTIPSAFPNSRTFEEEEYNYTATMDFTGYLPSNITSGGPNPQNFEPQEDFEEYDNETATMDFTGFLPGVIAGANINEPQDLERYEGEWNTTTTMEMTRFLPSTITGGSTSLQRSPGSANVTMEFTKPILMNVHSTNPRVTFAHPEADNNDTMEITQDLTSNIRFSSAQNEMTQREARPIIKNPRLSSAHTATQTPEKVTRSTIFTDQNETMEFTMPLPSNILSTGSPERDAFAVDFSKFIDSDVEDMADETMDFTTTISHGQNPLPEGEDCYDTHTMDLTTSLAVAKHMIQQDDFEGSDESVEHDPEFESTTDFTNALAGIFSTSNISPETVSEDPEVNFLDQMKVLNGLSMVCMAGEVGQFKYWEISGSPAIMNLLSLGQARIITFYSVSSSIPPVLDRISSGAVFVRAL